MAVITGTTDGIVVLVGGNGLLLPITVRGGPAVATIFPLGGCFVTTIV